VTFPYAPEGLTGDPFFTSAELASWLQLDPSTINTGTADLLAKLASDAIRDEIRLQVDHVTGETVTLWGDNGEILLLPQRLLKSVALQIAAQAYSNPEMHDQERVGWVEWQTKLQAMLLSPNQRTALDAYRRLDL
jgi:hypothetical protein